MLIPKKIYQTWKTKNLPPKLVNVRNKISKMNKNYEMLLFDDNDINEWVNINFANTIIQTTFMKLKVGAARADFWRYLILYKNGGIYLDIDSNININLNNFIQEDDTAIISREKNSGTSYFIQWALFFSPQHPILLKTINSCIFNILNKTDTWLPNLTGPGVFTNSVNIILKKKYNINTLNTINLYFLSDEKLNSIFNKKHVNNNVYCRFFGYDYNDYLSYDNGCKSELLQQSIHWKNDTEIFMP